MAQIFSSLLPANMDDDPFNDTVINVHPTKIKYIAIASVFCALPFIGVIPNEYILAYYIVWLLFNLLAMAISIDAYSYPFFCEHIKYLEDWHSFLQRSPYAPKDLTEDISAELHRWKSIKACEKILRLMMLHWIVVVYRMFKGRTLNYRIEAFHALITNREATTVPEESKARYDQSRGIMDIDLEKGSAA